MRSSLTLRREATSRFRRQDSFGALEIYCCLLDLHPQDYQVRLHVGDALSRLGQRARARQVFAGLALMHMEAGRTLPALLVAKALDELDPGATNVFEIMARLYGAGSTRTRVSALPPGIEPLPETEIECPPARRTPSRLLETATRAGAGLDAPFRSPEALPRLPIFSDLGPEDIIRVLRAMSRVRFAAGERILVQGEEGDSFYLIAHGAVRITREDNGKSSDLALLTQGAVLGEMALVLRTTRSATATALDEIDGLRVPFSTIEALARGRPGVARALERFTQQRLIKNIVLRTPLLRPFYPHRFGRLIEVFQRRGFAPGQDLLREGEQGIGLYVVTKGEVEVLRPEDGEQVMLALLRAGEVVGEMSLLDDTPVSATVRARTNVSSLFLPRERFDDLLAEMPAMREQLRSLAETRAMDNLLALQDLDDDDEEEEEEEGTEPSTSEELSPEDFFL